LLVSFKITMIRRFFAQSYDDGNDKSLSPKISAKGSPGVKRHREIRQMEENKLTLSPRKRAREERQTDVLFLLNIGPFE